MAGIIRYNTYVPRYRLPRADVAGVFGQSASGHRAVAGYDEDSTTMAVAAALPVVANDSAGVGSLWFATTVPAYVDKTNASTIHSALELPAAIAAIDLGATLRSGATALTYAARDGGLAVLADIRGGAFGGADEQSSADAAAAFRFGSEEVVAELVATASVTADFLDRWRAPGSADGFVWEERFAESRYTDLFAAVLASLREQGLDLSRVDRLVVAGANARSVRTVTRKFTKLTNAHSVGADLPGLVGYAGTAQVGLVLADALDAAEPDETILVVSLADGVDAMLLRTTPRLPAARGPSLRSQLADTAVITYPQMLLWRSRLVGEPPRRPAPERPSAPYAWRNREFKLALRGGRCRDCGAVQYPTPQICYRCRTKDNFDTISAAREPATIATFTIDHLAYSPNPPLISAIIKFGTGGRIQCELTDVTGPIAVGDKVQPTFRRGVTAGGIQNYIWKSRLITDSRQQSG